MSLIRSDAPLMSDDELPMARVRPRSQIHGADVDESTMAYQAANVTIHIGDQEDRSFWARFRRDVPLLDVIVDDGGHTPRQQQVTLEEMLPHLRAAGVYICEDIHSEGNAFAAYVAGLIDQLHACRSGMHNPTNAIQAAIASVYVYPFVVVIEKRLHPLPHLVSERHGTEWQPPVVCRDGYGKIHGRGGSFISTGICSTTKVQEARGDHPCRTAARSERGTECE
jgi:hypothetical protein